METLTYPYGETPEEVIRERLTAAKRDVYRKWSWPAEMDAESLLTVLDALRLAGDCGEPLSFGQDAEDLRRSILAALGVTER